MIVILLHIVNNLLEGYIMLTIAYIGFGNSVTHYHLPYVEKKKELKVKYIYRRAEDRIGDLARES